MVKLMNEENISFEELLNNSMKDEKLGKVANGTIISITKNEEIIVDLNYKADGIQQLDPLGTGPGQDKKNSGVTILT